MNIRWATYDGIVEPLKSRAEMAQLLGVTTKTVDNFVRRGMPSYKVGRLRRFRYEQVLEWLADNHPERL